jgi:hypothetical protein
MHAFGYIGRHVNPDVSAKWLKAIALSPLMALVDASQRLMIKSNWESKFW